MLIYFGQAFARGHRLGLCPSLLPREKVGVKDARCGASNVVRPCSRTSMLDARYAVGDLLGRGAFGHVYRCVDVRTGSTLAVKVLQTVRKREARDRTLHKVRREIDMHKLLSDCPHVAKYVDSFEDADEEQAGIAMEYCGGDRKSVV